MAHGATETDFAIRFIGDRQEDVAPPFELPTIFDFLGVSAGSRPAARSDQCALAILHISHHAFTRGATSSDAMFLRWL